MKIMRFAAVMILAGCLAAAPAMAGEAPAKKMEGAERLRILTDMVGLNTMADVYVKQCDDYEAKTKERPNFLPNVRATTDALAAEMVKQDPKLKTGDAAKQIGEAQQAVREKFAALVASDGCASEQARIAQNHYAIFSQSPPEFYLRFLETLE